MYGMDMIKSAHAVCLLRTYPLGFGLQYLSCFSSLKTEGNKLRKQYKAGYMYSAHGKCSHHLPTIQCPCMGPFVAALPASD